MRVLTETITSPTMAQQLQMLLKQFPNAAWHQYEPITNDTVQAGMRLAFGQEVNAVYHFDKAQVILALEADFLACEPGTLHYAHGFAKKRRVRGDVKDMNRLYVVESHLSLTGANADHRLPMRSSAVADLARALARALGAVAESPSSPQETTASAHWINAVADDLQQHRGASLVLAGRQQPPLVHALAQAMNVALGNVGETVVYTAPVVVQPVNQLASLRALVEDMASSRVELLLILGSNPVYTAPADFDFARHVARVPFSVHLSLEANETSALCHWLLPETHYLEAWGDARAYNGTVSLMQPLIEPLYGGKSASELLAMLLGQPEPDGRVRTP